MDESAEHFLEQKSSDTRACINRRQDKQRLEHNGEVVPVFPKPVGFTAHVGKDRGHANGQCDSPAGAAAQGFLCEAFVVADVFDLTAGDGQDPVVICRHGCQRCVHRIVITD